jgi:hypothetical protein
VIPGPYSYLWYAENARPTPTPPVAPWGVVLALLGACVVVALVAGVAGSPAATGRRRGARASRHDRRVLATFERALQADDPDLVRRFEALAAAGAPRRPAAPPTAPPGDGSADDGRAGGPRRRRWARRRPQDGRSGQP